MVLHGWESLYPGNELTEDWKKVLFNQFHDLAAGSGIGVIYKDAQKDYDQVHSSTNDISVRSLNRIIESMDAYTGKPKPSSRVLVVFNPLSMEAFWNRNRCTFQVMMDLYSTTWKPGLILGATESLLYMK